MTANSMISTFQSKALADRIVSSYRQCFFYQEVITSWLVALRIVGV